MIDRKEGHRNATSQDDDTDDTFVLIGLAADKALVAICNLREMYKLGDVMRGKRKAYLRGCEPIEEKALAAARELTASEVAAPGGRAECEIMAMPARPRARG